MLAYDVDRFSKWELGMFLQKAYGEENQETRLIKQQVQWWEKHKTFPPGVKSDVTADAFYAKVEFKADEYGRLLGNAIFDEQNQEVEIVPIYGLWIEQAYKCYESEQTEQAWEILSKLLEYGYNHCYNDNPTTPLIKPGKETQDLHSLISNFRFCPTGATDVGIYNIVSDFSRFKKIP